MCNCKEQQKKSEKGNTRRMCYSFSGLMHFSQLRKRHVRGKPYFIKYVMHLPILCVYPGKLTVLFLLIQTKAELSLHSLAIYLHDLLGNYTTHSIEIWNFPPKYDC